MMRRVSRESSPAGLNSFFAFITSPFITSPYSARTGNTLFFVSYQVTVFLDTAGIINSLTAFFPGQQMSLKNILRGQIVVEIEQQLHGNARIHPGLQLRDEADHIALIDILWLLIVPQLVFDKGRDDRYGAVAVVIDIKLTEDRQNTGGTSLNNRAAGVGRYGGDMAVADTVFGNPLEQGVPVQRAMFCKPLALAAENLFLRPFTAFKQRISAPFLGQQTTGRSAMIGKGRANFCRFCCRPGVGDIAPGQIVGQPHHPDTDSP